MKVTTHEYHISTKVVNNPFNYHSSKDMLSETIKISLVGLSLHKTSVRFALYLSKA